MNMHKRHIECGERDSPENRKLEWERVMGLKQNDSKRKNPILEMCTIDHGTSSTYHLDFLKLFLLFMIFSALGFLYEGTLSFFRNGEFRHFQGVIYGPFSQIYGLGAVLAIGIYRIFSNRSSLFIYLLYSVLGGTYEYLSSLIEEYFFGFVAWHYEGRFLNIQGRTTVIYALEWGLLAFFVVRVLSPFFCRIIEKIPRKSMIVMSWTLIVFFSLDMVLTAAALVRMSERHKQIPASNALEALIDREYPDAFIEKFIPNLQFKE
jgi:uncharacterized membrane protein